MPRPGRRPWSRSRPSAKLGGLRRNEAVTFFEKFDLEKLTLEDGLGNKAKLQRTKNNGIKIEYTSSVVL